MTFRIFLLITVWLGVLPGGCAWLAGETPPDWIMSPHQVYPPDRFLTGIGEAESREQAEQRAYTAVARVFSARVKAQSIDRETYALYESGDMSHTQRALQLDHRTQVTTSKVLENVKVLEVWYQPSKHQFFALAGLDRQQAEHGILERLDTLDATIENMVRQGRSHQQKSQRIRGYKESMGLLEDRTALNADLRVIRPSGESLMAPYQVPTIQREFQDFVSRDLVITVSLTGDHHDELERAILDGLKQEGLFGNVTASTSQEGGDLAIEGQGRIWTVALPDPLFKYVRWCGDIDIYENPGHKLIGVISETGREGHITEREAQVRASGVMQHVLSREVARFLTQSLLHPDNTPSDASRTSHACPQP